MPLYICGENASDSHQSVVYMAQNFPKLKEVSLSLSNSPARELTQEDCYLYINEGEFAGTTPQDEYVKLMTTDDATTCHILVLRHAESGATCLGHFMGTGTEQAATDMISLLVQLSNTPHPVIDAHLVGGFHDDRRISINLSSQLLECLKNGDKEIHLRTASITDVNDTVIDGIHWPLIYGLAVNVASGEITKVTVNPKLRGPDIDIRSAANYSLDRMVNIYDPTRHCLTIGPFHIESMPNIDLWCQMSDSRLTWSLSTSPQQERAHFATFARASLNVMKQHPDSMTTIFAGRPRRYTMSADGTWHRLAASS